MPYEAFRRAAIAVRQIITNLAREPLVHFLLLGLMLFGVYSYIERDRGGGASSTEIRLTQDDLAQLIMIFQSQWNRLPNQTEFNALVEDRIREDVLYREALSRGMDKDDEIVKRRMAQKMQFLAEDMATAREPTTKELRSWFAQNTKLFAVPARLSFRHLYFSPDRRGERVRADAAQALEKLAGQPQNSKLAMSIGDPFMFQDYYGDRTPQSVAREFGPKFAKAIVNLTPGSWQGPIKSGYGWHLVYVNSVIPGRVPAFEEIEQDVKTAWLGKQKVDGWRKAYKKIRSKYVVLLPVPAEAASNPKSNPIGHTAATVRDGGAPL